MATNGTARLRASCDACHRLKMKCSGCMPCQRCAESGHSCSYSVSSRLGRPPGVRKKRQPSQQSKEQAGAETEMHTSYFSLPSNKSTMKMQRQGPPSSETSALPSWNQWSLNANTSSLAKPAHPQKSQPHLQQLQLQTHTSLNTWPPMSPFSIVASDDSGVHPPVRDGGQSTADQDETKHMSWNNTNSQDYFSSLGGNWRSQMARGPSKKDMLEYRKVVLEDSPSTLLKSPQTMNFDMAMSIPDSVNLSTAIDSSWDEFQALVGSGVNAFSGNSVTDSSNDETEHCACLQHHTELLCTLKGRTSTRSSSHSGGSSLDARPTLNQTLRQVQEALRVWRGLINCQNCAHNDDQEVLLLALMCIRKVLSQLRLVCSSDPYDDSGQSESGVANCKSRSSQSQCRMPDVPAIDCSNEIQMLIGDFEVTGYDKSVLLRVLMANTLRKIAAMLMLLREVLERKKKLEKISNSSFMPPIGGARQEPRHSTSSLVHAEQMMQGLLSSVESRMSVLKPSEM